TLFSGILQAASNTALGKTTSGVVSVGSVGSAPGAAVLELNNAALTDQVINLTGGSGQEGGMFDQNSTVAANGVRMGSGGLRAMPGTTNSITDTIARGFL